MSAHSLFAPSAASRWVPCPGSMAYAENFQDSSSTYADDGTASHFWAAYCLESGKDADDLLGAAQTINGKTYILDEDRAGYIQTYLDDVRRRAIGGKLEVEARVDLSHLLGGGQGGTADALIHLPGRAIIEDLKYGMGERVDASHVVGRKPDGSEIREVNYQLGLYALGFLREIELWDDIETITVVVCQPRLHHIDEYTLSVAELQLFADKAAAAVAHAGKAMLCQPNGPELQPYLLAGEKQCRWCRAVRCEAREKRIAAEVKADFETIAATPPVVPGSTSQLQRAYSVLPFIEDWIRAVRAEVDAKVKAGEFIGEDGKPMKYVEGKPGKRQWVDPLIAEGTLMQQLGEKAYKPREIITAPAAAKLLDKKATKNLWNDVFVPMIKKAPGKPVIALGSDPRPAFVPAADASEFDEIDANE